MTSYSQAACIITHLPNISKTSQGPPHTHPTDSDIWAWMYEVLPGRLTLSLASSSAQEKRVCSIDGLLSGPASSLVSLCAGLVGTAFTAVFITVSAGKTGLQV